MVLAFRHALISLSLPTTYIPTAFERKKQPLDGASLGTCLVSLFSSTSVTADSGLSETLVQALAIHTYYLSGTGVSVAVADVDCRSNAWERSFDPANDMLRCWGEKDRYK